MSNSFHCAELREKLPMETTLVSYLDPHRAWFLSFAFSETQTNEDDFYYVGDDEVVVDDDFSFRDDFDQTGSVDQLLLPPDDRISAHLFPALSPRESPRSSALAMPIWSGSPRPYQPHATLQQQQHLQPHRLYHSSSHQLLQQQQQHPQVGKDNFHVDKISWSVSQLRSLFNQDRSESGENVAAAYSEQQMLQQQHPPLVRDSSQYRVGSHSAHTARYHPQVGKTASSSAFNNSSHFSNENSDEESYV